MLAMLIREHCPSLSITGTYNSPEAGLSAILENAPDVLFLDIEMPGMTGFELLEKARPLELEVIFTTAYDSYAIQAIRYSALDYLLKPVRQNELTAAVDKLIEVAGQRSMQSQMELLLTQIRSPTQSLDKIALSTTEGLEIVDVDQILYCEAQSNYTLFHFMDRKRLMVSKTLKQIDELLKDQHFFRVHQSYLVNLRYVRKYVRGDGAYVILEGDTTVSVAQSRKESLTRRLTDM